MGEGKNDDLKGEKLPPITPLDKIIVAAAGPLFSLLLAFFFAVIVWVVGHPDTLIESTKIGYVQEGSPAEEAGLKEGDEILAINGEAVSCFHGIKDDSLKTMIMLSEGEKIEISYNRPGVDGVQTVMSGYELGHEGGFARRRGLRQIGIGWTDKRLIESVVEDSPAERAGLQAGDQILAVNGQEIHSSTPIFQLAAENQTMGLEIKRGEEVLNFEVAPEIPEGSDKPMLGIGFDTSHIKDVIAHPDPLTQVVGSAKKIWLTVKKVASPKSDVGLQHLAGPVGITRTYHSFLSQPDGWRMVFWFSVLLNVNLAILNMLPFPVLDGGHITMAVMEGVFKRPISEKILVWVQGGAVAALVSFMLYVTWFDSADTIRDISGTFSQPKKAEKIKFESKGSAESNSAPSPEGGAVTPALDTP